MKPLSPMQPILDKLLFKAHIKIVEYDPKIHAHYLVQAEQIIRQQIYYGNDSAKLQKLFLDTTCLFAVDTYSNILLGLTIYEPKYRKKAEILILAKSHLTGHHRSGIGTFLIMSVYARLEETCDFVYLSSSPQAIPFYRNKIRMQPSIHEDNLSDFRDRPKLTEFNYKNIKRCVYKSLSNCVQVDLTIQEPDPISGLYKAKMHYHSNGKTHVKNALIAKLPPEQEKTGTIISKAVLYSPQTLSDEDPELPFIGVYFTPEEQAALTIQQAYRQYTFRKQHAYFIPNAVVNHIQWMKENF